MGMTGFETKAALEGLFSEDNTFLTTPKSGAPTQAIRRWSDDVVAALGYVIALHQIVAVQANDPFSDLTWIVHRYISIFWNICYVAGLICMSTAFFCAKYKKTTFSSVSFFRKASPLLRMAAIAVLVAGCQCKSFEEEN